MTRAAPPPLILVVDDNVDAREMYATCLEHAGFRCQQAGTGTETLRMARAEKPVLVLMDASMPDMDGWEAVRQMRADKSLAGVAIIMLTAHAYDEHRRRALEIGADEFMAKPVLPDELERAIRRLLRLGPRAN